MPEKNEKFNFFIRNNEDKFFETIRKYYKKTFFLPGVSQWS